ncbi:hypothetical protein BTM25_26820 [Actinomadura rubteroloni]|uniref:N-acetyltransferase domain-containing protein n=1 Tax=Actinomadura rubteroloni TaxID=1926885 RepID=A0A2P4UG70_9ACTN|nr:GNAT family N-acetyltransferase [Actinomadura rubteroloni]POM24055.1 hypothetical protein BTM25_26820 [Actinomadura rubteroloni]
MTRPVVMPLLHFPNASLRSTWLEAMAEHAAVDGRPDADGLGMEDLRTSNADWLQGYCRALNEGTMMRPGTEPLRPSVWWYVTAGRPDTREYLGRVSIRHHAMTHAFGQEGSQIWVSVRPSRRRQGVGAAMLAAALPMIRAQGIIDAVVEIDKANQAGTALAARIGAERVEGHAAERHGRLRYMLLTVGAG